MSLSVTHQKFKSYFIQAHKFVDHAAIKADCEWFRLQLKWKLIGKSRSKWPQSFYDEARKLMNEWKTHYKRQRERISRQMKNYCTQNKEYEIRSCWTMHSHCLFFLQSQHKWFPAIFGRLTDWNNQDLLTVIYTDSNIKKTITIQRASPNIQPFPPNHPKFFQCGSFCQIYINDTAKWYDGIVDHVLYDEDKEWLKGRYLKHNNIKTFCIQRYSKDIRLLDDIDHFASLPLSLQIFIKWVKSVEYSLKRNGDDIIDLDWNAIEKDLKYQCNKYKDNKEELKEIFYDFRLDCSEYIPYSPLYDVVNKENKVYFYDNPTIIHYILRYYDKHSKVMEDGFKIIKLLVLYEIITGEELYSGGSFPYSILDVLCSGVKYHSDNDAVTDLICVICTERPSLEQQAILTVVHDRNTFSIQHIFDLEEGNTKKGPLLFCVPLYNKNDVLRKLLFRGMYPFQFVKKDITVKENIPSWNRTDVTIKEIVKQPVSDGEDELTMNDTKNTSTSRYIECLIQRFNVLDNSSKYKDDEHSICQHCIVSPLVLYPYLCEVKQQMFKLLTEHTDLALLIIETIVSYIYINYDLFYPQQIRNNLKVKVLDFVNNISLLNMAQDYINDVFDKRMNDKVFINYLFEDDGYTTEIVQSLCKGTWRNEYDEGGEILYKLISTEGVQVSLEALYYMMISMINSGDYKVLIKLLKFAQLKYGATFDINYGWKEGIKYKLLIRSHDREERASYTIMSQLIRGMYNTGTMDAIKCILKEYNFDITCDLGIRIAMYDATSTVFDNISLLTYLLVTFNDYKSDLVEYLLIECKNKYEYSVNDICKCIVDIMKGIGHGKKRSFRYNNSVWMAWKKIEWCKLNGIDFSRFVETINNCLQIRCNNDQDITMMNNTLKKMKQWLREEIEQRKRSGDHNDDM